MGGPAKINENKQEKQLTFVEPAWLALLLYDRKSTLRWHDSRFLYLLRALYLINGANFHLNGSLTRGRGGVTLVHLL